MNKTTIYLEDTIEEIVRRLGIKDESFLTAQEKAIVKILRSMPPAQKELPDTDSLNVSADCSDCIAHGGDFECDRIQCHKGTKLANLQQTCNLATDCISRQDTIDAMCKLMNSWFGGDPKDEREEITRIINHLPPTQPQHMKAKWECKGKPNSGKNVEWVCTHCGFSVWAEFCNYKYCNNCGYYMCGKK